MGYRGGQGTGMESGECHRRRQRVLRVYAIALACPVDSPVASAVYLRSHARNMRVYLCNARNAAEKTGVKYCRFSSIALIDCDTTRYCSLRGVAAGSYRPPRAWRVGKRAASPGASSKSVRLNYLRCIIDRSLASAPVNSVLRETQSCAPERKLSR